MSTAKDGKSEMTYTEQASKRKHCVLLTNFVRLVDYLVANALQSLAVDSTRFLRDHLETIIRRSDKVDEEFVAAVAAAVAAAAALPPVDGKPRQPAKVLKKTSKQNPSEPQPMFKVCYVFTRGPTPLRFYCLLTFSDFLHAFHGLNLLIF